MNKDIIDKIKNKEYKVLFTDLDGTLIETISGKTFPEGIWDMKFKFDVLDTIKKLSPEYIFIVTNQGGIEKGFVTIKQFEYKFNYILQSVSCYCNCITDGIYCPNNDVNCSYRKPNTDMLQTMLPYNINKLNCLMIGDASGLEGQFSDTDKKTAENFGIDYLDFNEFVKLVNN